MSITIFRAHTAEKNPQYITHLIHLRFIVITSDGKLYLLY